MSYSLTFPFLLHPPTPINCCIEETTLWSSVPISYVEICETYIVQICYNLAVTIMRL